MYSPCNVSRRKSAWLYKKIVNHIETELQCFSLTLNLIDTFTAFCLLTQLVHRTGMNVNENRFAGSVSEF